MTHVDILDYIPEYSTLVQDKSGLLSDQEQEELFLLEKIVVENKKLPRFLRSTIHEIDFIDNNLRSSTTKTFSEIVLKHILEVKDVFHTIYLELLTRKPGQEFRVVIASSETGISNTINTIDEWSTQNPFKSTVINKFYNLFSDKGWKPSIEYLHENKLVFSCYFGDQ